MNFQHLGICDFRIFDRNTIQLSGLLLQNIGLYLKSICTIFKKFFTNDNTDFMNKFVTQTSIIGSFY